MARTSNELNRVWTAKLEEQNGTERKALYLYPFPEGEPILAVDLGSVPHFAKCVDIVLSALKPELLKIAKDVKTGASFLYCPVDVRDAQKNGETAFDLYAAIRCGERAAVDEVVGHNRAVEYQRARNRESQPTLEDALGYLSKAASAIEYVNSTRSDLDGHTLSLSWDCIVHAIRHLKRVS
jgi:hypothetical protein